MDSTPQNPIIEIIKQTLSNKLVDFQVKQNGHVVETKWQVRPLYATKSKDNYASMLYVAEHADSENTSDESVSLIVKVLPEDLTMRVVQNSDKQFYNEKNMFVNVIPLMLSNFSSRDAESIASMFPKCYYADCDPVNAMIIMENLQEQQFELTELLLDYDHCKMSLEGLARFHAVSYAMKHKCSSVFKTQIVDTFVEARFCEQNNSRQNVFMRYTSMDPVNFILKSEDKEWIAFRIENASFLRRLEAAFERTVDLLVRSVVPKEPLAVLCHGDFNRNNIMFRHENRKPTHVKFLDFQTVRYANPATDIVFLFYLNTTAELRSKHLDDLLSAYQKTLVHTLVEMEVAPREELERLYSLEAFKEDYERHALNGYMISAMFNHFMLGTPEELEQVMALKQADETLEEPSQEYLKCVVSLGGEEAMRRSVAIVKEMAVMKHCFDNEYQNDTCLRIDCKHVN